MAPRNLRVKGATFTWTNGFGVMLLSEDGEVGRDVQRRAYAVQKRMKRAAGYRTGVLRRGIKVESVRRSKLGPYSKVVSTAPHTMVHEVGREEVTRGVGQVIYAGEYRDALYFQPKRGMRKIWRNRVPAVEGKHFMENSIDAALD